MKRIFALVLTLVMVLSLAACGSPTPQTTPDNTKPSDNSSTAVEDKFELAMITDIGTIDDKSFNQGTWEGVKKYAEEKGITHKYYKPTEKSNDAYLSAIDLAVKGGAKVVVTPGFLFEEPIYIAQDQYPDVNFVLIDGNPHDANYNYRTEKNTVGVLFAEEQAGFLAGYAAVKDGYTKLGFMGGMAVPAVVRYGYGFVQGAEFAAKEMGLAPGSITINYHYTGGFDATPEVQTLAASWYQSGIEVIFACGGALGNSVMAAAEQTNGKVIGVDVDQSYESNTVITSAMKGLGEAVYAILDQYYKGTFPGGQGLIFSAKNKGVGLPMATSKFNKFTQADYDAIYEKLANDTDGIASNLVKDTDASGKSVAVTDLKTSAVVLKVVE
ncbi:MAG: BMP family ABC transporter substrate-binding protein [Thermoanaerobacteraceae bacterium]|nr:BMP family ABC transporter substrate-binding protein [Thermoanaerobacteraceae bacterium]